MALLMSSGLKCVALLDVLTYLNCKLSGRGDYDTFRLKAAFAGPGKIHLKARGKSVESGSGRFLTYLVDFDYEDVQSIKQIFAQDIKQILRRI